MSDNGKAKKNWQSICVTLSHDFVQWLDDFCYENDIARSAVVEYALMQIFKDKDEPKLKALAKRIASSGYDRVSRRSRYAKSG